MMNTSNLPRAITGILVMSLWALAFVRPAAAGPTIERWRTDSGARVHLVRATELPIIDIRVVFDAGSARDGAASGLAALTSAVIGEGAGGLSSDEFNERMAATGARFGAGTAQDMAWLSLRSLTDPASLDPALELFRQAIIAPNFAPDAVARERERTLAGIRRADESPGEIAEKAWFAAVYAKHPYGTPVEGTLESVAALDPVALRRFHDTYYVAANAVIAIVGDISSADARRLADRVLRDLPVGAAASPPPAVADLTEAREISISHPSAQTHILLGQPGITRKDPDYFPLVVGNHILGGGGLVSLLFEEIREKRGLSYDVSSSFAPMAQRGPFIAGLQTDGPQAHEARDVLKQTIRDFIERGPTAAELELAKRNIIGGFPLRIDSNAKITEYVAMIGFYDLPLDFLDAYKRQVQALTPDVVREAMGRRIDVDRMILVTVGAAP